MPIPKFFADMKGSYSGPSTLNLPWMKEPKEQLETSTSKLKLEVGPKNGYASISYSWSYRGAKQEGVMIIAGQKLGDPIDLAWVDSWHQNPNVMKLTGSWESDEKLVVLGSYSAGDGPAWGWRIVLTKVDDKTLKLEMTNIHPDKQEDWAVRAEYKRSK